jgi:hypothetical protein
MVEPIIRIITINDTMSRIVGTVIIQDIINAVEAMIILLTIEIETTAIVKRTLAIDTIISYLLVNKR